MATVATDIKARTTVLSTVNEREAFAVIKEYLTKSTTLASDTGASNTNTHAIAVTEDTLLLESGILDSLGILQLMTFLSESMGIEISDEDFVAENFKTVGSLARFISEKQSVHAG